MKKILILLTILGVLGTSCKKDFLAVNEYNPNNAAAVAPNLVLPAALNTTSRIVTLPGNYQFVYFWYGCMAVSGGYSQPTNLTQYNLLNSDYQGNWNNSYLNLQNYDYIEKNSTTEKQQAYKAIAMIMKAYHYQYLVDAYGNVPYSQALQADKQILKPEYDDMQSIYEDLVLKLDEAMELINTAPVDPNNELGAYDIIYGGNLNMWLKFANTLKLRLLINQSDMTGRTGYITSALATTPTSADSYIGAGESAMLNPGYVQTANKMNPFWETFYKQDNSVQNGMGYYVAGQDACDFLTATNDPRKLRFFQANSANGSNVKGNYFGAIVLEPVPSTSKIGPGMLAKFDQDAPIFTDFESLFLQAEAVVRGLIPGNAKALYESAVSSSISYEGVASASAASSYLAQGNPNVNYDLATNKMKLILTQKWCALNGVSPMPIWTDYRRTGFPDFIHWSQAADRRNNTPPVRLFYPQTEISTNNDNVQAQGDIDLFTSKIFWQNR